MAQPKQPRTNTRTQNKPKQPLPILEKMTITDIAAEGKAIAKKDDMVIFVPFVIPGDVVDLQITRQKKRFAEAHAVKFHALSPERIEPFCQHYGECGGCKWQVLPYEAQLAYKQQQVSDNLARIGKVSLPTPQPILGSNKQRFYRNKLEFSFATEVDKAGQKTNTLGFHKPGFYDQVIRIDHCSLQSELSNEILNSVRDFAKANEIPFYNYQKQRGLLRSLIIRSSNLDETMVIVVAKANSNKDKKQLKEVLMHIHESFPALTSLLYVLNNDKNDSFTHLDVETFAGQDFITEAMGDLRFKVGAKSFYQTNADQAEVLYQVVQDFAGLTGEELVYDLYTGTGTIANFVAKGAKKVIGVEYVNEAIEDAKANAKMNGIENAAFFAGDMKNVLTQSFLDEQGAPDVIITDPPRAGMDVEVINAILLAKPKKIVYVSCNPATQARDLQLLDADYQVTKVQALDMFPQTHHVENVVLLELRSM